MSAPNPLAPRPLWQEAHALLAALFALFGEPQAIAFQHTLTATAHRLLAQWLRGAEALVRQLLLIQAASLAPPACAARKKRAKQEKRVLEFWPDKPEHWRVSFRIFMDRRRPRRPAPRMPAGRRRSIAKSDARFFSAWPLAERAEALLRVFNDPAPYARRLARRLYALPARLERLARDLHAPGIISDATCALVAPAHDNARRHFANTS